MGALTTIIEITIDGIGTGMLWAMLGVGITLVFGLGNVLNLAQGIFAVIGAAVVLEMTNGDIHIVPAILGGIIALGVLSYAIDKVVLTRVYRSEGEERVMVAIFVTVGLLLAMEGLMYQRFPGSFSLPANIPSLNFGSVTIVGASILNIGTGIVIFSLLFFYLNYTYSGNAAKTITLDETGAYLCGIDVRRMRTVIFVLSGMLAAVAGILYGIGTEISVGGAFELTVFALLVSIVGGVRHIDQTVIAGIGLGVVYSYASYFIGSYVAMIVLFLAVMVAIVIRKEEAL